MFEKMSLGFQGFLKKKGKCVFYCFGLFKAHFNQNRLENVALRDFRAAGVSDLGNKVKRSF